VPSSDSSIPFDVVVLGCSPRLSDPSVPQGCWFLSTRLAGLFFFFVLLPLASGEEAEAASLLAVFFLFFFFLLLDFVDFGSSASEEGFVR